MKKLSLIFLLAAIGLSASSYAAQAKTQNKVLAATNCASNCESCWDQCTSADNCGVGFNCSTSPCGNRCTKQ